MNIQTQTNDNCTLTLTVEVEAERLQAEMRTASKRISKNYRIPGFRPGKAPYETILRHFGEDALFGEAIEGLTQKIYEEALDQAKIEPYAPGALDDVQREPSLTLKYTVPLKPVVSLGDYRAVRVPFAAPDINDEAVNKAMDEWRESRAVMDPVERPAALGDIAVLDVNAFLNDGQNPSDFLLADKDVSLLLEEAADWPMPGFAPHIVGMSAGENKKFDQAFPEDYANDSLRGQVAHAEVTIKEVKSRTLPEWTDELAKEFGDYQSLAEMRAKVREGLDRQATRELERDYSTQVMDKLLEQTTIQYPPILLESELDDMLEDLDRRLKEQKLTLDDYLKIEGKTKDGLREEYKPQAETRLKRGLALGELVEQEQLKVDETDVNAEVEKFVSIFGGSADAEALRKSFASAKARSSLALDLLTNKAMQRLMALAKGEDIPLPVKLEDEAEALPTATPVPAATLESEPPAA